MVTVMAACAGTLTVNVTLDDCEESSVAGRNVKSGWSSLYTGMAVGPPPALTCEKASLIAWNSAALSISSSWPPW